MDFPWSIDAPGQDDLNEGFDVTVTSESATPPAGSYGDKRPLLIGGGRGGGVYLKLGL